MNTGQTMHSMIARVVAGALLATACGACGETAGTDANDGGSDAAPNEAQSSPTVDGGQISASDSGAGDSGQASDSGAADEPDEAGPSVDAATADAGPASSRTPGTCGDVPQGIVTLGSVAEFRALLVGRWRYCSSKPSYGNTLNMTHSADEVGIEFAADGTWYTLTQVSGGPLVRSTAGSLTEQGTWDTLTNGTTPAGGLVVQLDVNFANGGLPWQLTFSVTPTEFSGYSDAGQVTYVAVQ